MAKKSPRPKRGRHRLVSARRKSPAVVSGAQCRRL